MVTVSNRRPIERARQCCDNVTSLPPVWNDNRGTVDLYENLPVEWLIKCQQKDHGQDADVYTQSVQPSQLAFSKLARCDSRMNESVKSKPLFE